jgi:hypothetical protein
MKDHILIFVLAFVLWAWLNLHATREKKKKRAWTETKNIAVERLNRKTGSDERNATTIKYTGDLPKTNRYFTMSAYPYLQKESRNGNERRRSRVPVGITFEFIDRRQTDRLLYDGPERRSGMDRRGLFWDRRKPKVPCYR